MPDNHQPRPAQPESEGPLPHQREQQTRELEREEQQTPELEREEQQTPELEREEQQTPETEPEPEEQPNRSDGGPDKSLPPVGGVHAGWASLPQEQYDLGVSGGWGTPGQHLTGPIPRIRGPRHQAEPPPAASKDG